MTTNDQHGTIMTNDQYGAIMKAQHIAGRGRINLNIHEEKGVVCVNFRDGVNAWWIYIGPKGGLHKLNVRPDPDNERPAYDQSIYQRSVRKAERYVRYGSHLWRDDDRLLSFGPLVDAAHFGDAARAFVSANGT